jgi:hypothetical protein
MDRRYVGIDLHGRRSVVYAMDAAGDKLFCERIANRASHQRRTAVRCATTVSTTGYVAACSAGLILALRWNTLLGS